MQIFVNGRIAEVENTDGLITYEDICQVAGYKPEHCPTVVWATKASQGSICAGQAAPLVERSIFNVGITGAA